MGLNETANLLAVLAGARRPVWTPPGDNGNDTTGYTGAPQVAGAGVEILDNASDSRGVLAVGVYVAMREDVHRRTFRITIPVFDAASTYTVTINGAATSGASQATITLLLAELVTDINTAAAATITAIADPDAPTTTVLVTGDAEADYTIGVSVAAGTGTILATADPTSATIRAFTTLAGTMSDGSALPTNWCLVPEFEYTADYRGYRDTFQPPGCGRFYVELDDLTGTGDVAGASGTITYAPTVLIGPCVVE